MPLSDKAKALCGHTSSFIIDIPSSIHYLQEKKNKMIILHKNRYEMEKHVSMMDCFINILCRLVNEFLPRILHKLKICSSLRNTTVLSLFPVYYHLSIRLTI